MSAQGQLELAEWGVWLALLAPAFIGLYVGIRLRQTLIGSALGVVVAWVSANVIEYYITMPLRDIVAPPGDEISDIGTGSLGLLVLGWVIPLFSVLIALLFRYLDQRSNRPPNASTSAEPIRLSVDPRRANGRSVDAKRD